MPITHLPDGEKITGTLRGPSELPRERLIDAAGLIYKSRGYLPLDILVALESHGCFIGALERTWEEEMQNAVE